VTGLPPEPEAVARGRIAIARRGTATWADALFDAYPLNEDFGPRSAAPEHVGDGRFKLRVRAGGESALVSPSEARQWLGARQAPAAGRSPRPPAAGDR
jgi:hypothetical protein